MDRTSTARAPGPSTVAGHLGALASTERAAALVDHLLVALGALATALDAGAAPSVRPADQAVDAVLRALRLAAAGDPSAVASGRWRTHTLVRRLAHGCASHADVDRAAAWLMCLRENAGAIVPQCAGAPAVLATTLTCAVLLDLVPVRAVDPASLGSRAAEAGVVLRTPVRRHLGDPAATALRDLTRALTASERVVRAGVDGDVDAERRHLRAAARAFRALGMPADVANCSRRLAHCDADADPAGARDRILDARSVLVEFDRPLCVASCDLDLGALALEHDGPATARAALRSARATFVAAGRPREVGTCEALLATAAVDDGDQGLAAAHFAAAADFLDVAGDSAYAATCRRLREHVLGARRIGPA